MSALSEINENVSYSFEGRALGPRAQATEVATEAALASAPPIEVRPLPKSVLQRKVPDELARSFTPLEAKQLRDAFSLFDREGHGFIARQDLDNVLVELGELPTPEDLAQLLASVMLTRAPTISFGDFCHMLHRAKPHQHASAFALTAKRVAHAPPVEGSTTLRFQDGSVFQGQCSAGGVFHGVGKYEAGPSGDAYTGEFRGGTFHGAGHLWYRHGGTYAGSFADGVKHGDGVHQYRDGSSFVGAWHLGLFEGYGEHRCASGDVYKGQFARGKKHGGGKLFYRDGGTFEGQWCADTRQAGPGATLLPNGDVYEGGFQKWGLYHGQGKFTHGATGDVYEGAFVEGKKHGTGTMRYRESGEEYEGEWRKGTKTGQGVWRFADGSVYAGEWLNGRMEGAGRYTYASGGAYEGGFRLDRPHGRGVATYANGNVYEGSFKDGVPWSAGAMQYAAEGAAWAGKWKQGRRVPGTEKAGEENAEEERA